MNILEQLADNNERNKAVPSKFTSEESLSENVETSSATSVHRNVIVKPKKTFFRRFNYAITRMFSSKL